MYNNYNITYDGIDLDFSLLKKSLKNVNKNFHYYTNSLSSCDIVKNNEVSIYEAGLEFDEETRSSLDFVWSSPIKTYRGILYCIPKKLSKEELNKLGLRE